MDPIYLHFLLLIVVLILGVLSFLMSKIEFWIDIKIEINLGELFQTLEYIKGLKVKVKF